MMLVELTAKSSLVLSAALVAVAVLRHGSAATRHIVLASAFVTTLALPAIVVVGPHWHIPSLSRSTETRGPLLSGSVDPARRRANSDGTILHALQSSLGASDFRSHRPADYWVRVLTIIWLLGVAIHAVRLCLGIASSVRLVREAEPLTDSDWNESLTSVAHSMTLAHPVALCTSTRAAVPLAWRLGRSSTLILPPEAKRWEADTRRAVLLHECGHLYRHDCAIRSLAVLSCGLWWFNPLAYLALRRLRREQEQACDDAVLAAGMAPVDYARQLLEMARRSVAADLPRMPILAIVCRSELEDRMFAIVDRSRRRGPLSPQTRLVATTVVVAFVAALGGLRLSAAPTPSSTQGVVSLRATGPGGPLFEWTREVGEETRRRVAGALEATSTRDSDAQVRAEADQILQTIRDMPTGTVILSESCRGNCLVGTKGLPSMAALMFETETKMALLELESRTEIMRRYAVARLSPHSETGADALAELLGDPDHEVRSLAAIRLDSVIFPPAVPRWIALLVDEDESLRERAAISLGVIGDPAAIDALTSALLNDPNADVRRQAARSLGRIATGS
jgi:beta-lactamase regulating signal transducer with metallopeptidase domain